MVKQYEFIDVNEYINVTNDVLVESPYILEYNDYLENLIEGLRVTSVTGRELIPKVIIANKNENTNGQRFYNSKYETRDLIINYILESESSADLMLKYEKLNLYLSKNQLNLLFNDENRVYTGTLSGVGEVTPGTLRLMSSFTITCSNPFKYSTRKVKSGSETITVLGGLNSLNTVLKKITLTVNSMLNPNIEITGSNLETSFNSNDKYNIIFNKSKIGLNDVLILDFENSKVYKNNIEDNSIMNWSSDFENITGFKNYRVLSTNNTLNVEYVHEYI